MSVADTHPLITIQPEKRLYIDCVLTPLRLDRNYNGSPFLDWAGRQHYAIR